MKHHVLNSIVFIVLYVPCSTAAYKYHINLNKPESAKNFPHFWRSTGQSPPDARILTAKNYLLSLEEKINLILIGSLSNDAIEQVRIHWLLNLVSIKFEEGQFVYNFTFLDDLMDTLRTWDLKPGFELMGNPSNVFTDFENNTQICMWKELVQSLGVRYIEKYGEEWVHQWNWESWNEPDHHDFGTLNFTVKGFSNYFDASRQGLELVSKKLRLGGPGGSCRDPSFTKFCLSFLKHCNNGSSIFSPGVPPRLDFISFHKKGKEDVDSMMLAEKETTDKIRQSFPELKHVPFYNDEGDFMKGWWKERTWKAKGLYAALVARSVTKHAKFILNNPRYKLLSFDNAFLNDVPHSYFRQRTLFTRFKYGNDSRNVRFIKKPSYYVMGILSLLGNNMFLPLESAPDERVSFLMTTRNASRRPTLINSGQRRYTFPIINRRKSSHSASSASYHHKESGDTVLFGSKLNITVDDQNDSDAMQKYYQNINAVRTRESTSPAPIQEISMLLSFTNRTRSSSGERACIQVTIEMPKAFTINTIYMVDYNFGKDFFGPFEVWAALGSPKRPTEGEIAMMRLHERPARSKIKKILMDSSSIRLKYHLNLGSMKLVHICRFENIMPPKITNLQIAIETSKDILLTWSDQLINNRCIDTFEVFLSTVGRRGPFHRVSRVIHLENSYFFPKERIRVNNYGTGIWITVRATLYNGVQGPFVRPVHYL